jgi:SAM-dependent methyltransferase
MYDRSSPHRYVEDEEAVRRAEELQQKTLKWLERLSSLCSPIRVLVELGCGNGALRNVHPGWVGVDLSIQACKNVLQTGDMRVVAADLHNLPFGSNCVDLVITWATLEHLRRPDVTADEIARILRPGGIAVLGPSWHCRSWTVKRLRFKSYASLSWRLKIEKATIPLRELLLWRAISALPFRVGRELKLLFRAKMPFTFKSLSPELDTNTPHVSDDDAFASIDSHACICYFISHGWRCISHASLLDRVLARHEEIVVIKPFKSKNCSLPRNRR